MLAFMLLGIGYWLLGSPYPILLALIGALAWLIPVVGAPLAIILPLLIGLLTSVQLSLFTVLYTLVVLIALQVWVEPRLYKRKWNNPILTLVILLAMADAFGLLGILVAPPLSVVCQILWSRLVSNRLASGASRQVSDLKERQARLSDCHRGDGWNCLRHWWSAVWSGSPTCSRKLNQFYKRLCRLKPSNPFHLSQPVTGEDEVANSHKNHEKNEHDPCLVWLDILHSFGNR